MQEKSSAMRRKMADELRIGRRLNDVESEFCWRHELDYFFFEYRALAKYAFARRIHKIPFRSCCDWVR